MDASSYAGMLLTMRTLQESGSAGSAYEKKQTREVHIAAEELEHDCDGAGSTSWRISGYCFDGASRQLVLLDGERGHFFSKRLHHALAHLVTDGGRDFAPAAAILQERLGVRVYRSDLQHYIMMTSR